MPPLRIVAISDTHLRHGALALPDGDVLVHGGDMTGRGLLPEIHQVADWLADLPHRHKVVVAGNHDWAFQREPDAARRLMAEAGVHYLEDSGVTLDGVHFWGSPWQPEFMAWAFNLPRGAPLAERWALIPADTDVLITHGPPRGHGDRCWDGRHEGCDDLLEAVRRVQPQLHVFGHIHEGYGTTTLGPTTLANAASLDVRYRPVNPPLVFDVHPRSPA